MRHHPDCDVYQAEMDREANEVYGLNLEIDPGKYTCYCDNEVKVRQISGTITLSNGETVEFLIGPNSDQRWGNTRENLAHAVLPCETMSTALWENEHYEKEV